MLFSRICIEIDTYTDDDNEDVELEKKLYEYDDQIENDVIECDSKIDDFEGKKFYTPIVGKKKLNNANHLSSVVFYGSPKGVRPKRQSRLLRLLDEIRIELEDQHKSMQEEAMNYAKDFLGTMPDDAIFLGEWSNDTDTDDDNEDVELEKKLYEYDDEIENDVIECDSKIDDFEGKEGMPCHLYFDLEFNIKENTEKNGDEMVDLLITIIFECLLEKYSIQGDTNWIVELDSSTKDKFSRHLIIHLLEMSFKDNRNVGVFVNQFLSQKDSLWTKVIVAIHGVGGKIHSEWTSTGKSCWLSILSEVRSLKETATTSLVCSFRRIPRGGIEQNQFDSLVELVRSVTIVPSADRWNWNLESTGIFSVASARRRIDEICLPNIGEETRWVKCVPIKINVLAWKIKTDALPTRFNISRRGIDIQDMSCPICDNAFIDGPLFFMCGLVRDIASNKVLSGGQIWRSRKHENQYAEWQSVAFNIKENAEKNGDEMVDLLITIIFECLLEKYSIQGDTNWIVELDSSTKDKFSHHLIICLPEMAFKDNRNVGVFVNQICSLIHCARGRDENFKQLFISKDSSSADVPGYLFIDTVVYSRNRCIRLHLSSKAGKNSVLLPTGRFKCKEMSEEDVFMVSLICNVGADCEKLLICNMDIDFIKFLNYDTERNSRRIQIFLPMDGYVSRKSAFPKIDEFIEYISSIGDVKVMYVVDLQRAVYYQKCHDPDCRGYRSPFRPVPPDVMSETFIIGEQNGSHELIHKSPMDSYEEDEWWCEAMLVTEKVENKPIKLDKPNELLGVSHGISLETSKKKRKTKKKIQKKAVQGKITKFFNKEELQKTKVLKVNNTTKFKKISSKRLGYKSLGCKFKDMMFLTSIIRKRKSSGKDSLNSYKERRLNSENYPKTRKLIDEFNLEEVFGENVKVCGYRRSEDVNQNIHNRELLDVIEIDVEVDRVKNDISKKQKDSSETQQEWISIRTRGSPKVLYKLMNNLSPAQMKDIIDIGFGFMIEMATEEIPVKIAHFVVDKFDADLMKLKLEHDVISITPDLVYKVLGVPLGGEDINNINKLGREDVTTLAWYNQFNRRNPIPKKVYDKIKESEMGGILFKLNFLVLFSNAMGFSGKGGQCMPGKSIVGYINEETRIENMDWCKYVCDCLKMSKTNWIRDDDNSYYSGPLTVLTLMYLTSTKSDSVSVPRKKHAIDNSSMDDDLTTRQRYFKLPQALDDRIHHESRYGNDFRETDYSLNFNDTSGTYHVGECSHGVEELDKDFINETDEENGEESSEEEMIEVVSQKVIEDFQKVSEVVCIVEKSRESNIQNEEQMFVKGTDEEKDEEILNQDVSEVNVLKVIEAELDSISEKLKEDHMVIINKDEDEFNEFKVKKDTLFDFKTFDIPKIDDKEKSAVSVFEDCLTKGLFRQVAEPDNSIISFGNPFRDSRNDMPNHRLDEAPSFSLGPEFDDFSIEEINQTNVNDANITINPNIESGVGFSETEADCSQKEKQSLDRILKVSFRPESEVDVLKEDIKPEIKDASIRMQPKREASVAWYLKSPFKVRGSALNSNTNTLSQAEVLAADTLFIMDEESDPFGIVYSSSTSNFKITRISLESLAPGLKIDQSVIDAWVDLLNFDERNKSSGSPSRYFFKPILTDHLKIEDYITTEYRLYKFEECINLCDYETKRMLNSDKMFHLVFFPVCTLDHFFLICFHMKTGKVVIIDNSSVDDDLTTRQRYFKLPQALVRKKLFLTNTYPSPERRASIFRNVEPERMRMKWRTNENEFDDGVFLMSHMDNYFGEDETRILLSENNSFKDEFQKEVEKVRSIDKKTRREVIENAILRRHAKVDEYFGKMKP
ncbi:RNA-directed DNA polymerase, eukaryota [Tanacetum coccineum]|uniref:DNA-directed primase/polymerase protein n=1 Tax=Tanacetum coccineum TaxID=301880 RepID=A0ABQ5D5D7_9ASTR